MRLYQAWLSISLAVLVTVVSDVSALSSRRRADLREEVREVCHCCFIFDNGVIVYVV
jgi:hypothetical protein